MEKTAPVTYDTNKEPLVLGKPLMDLFLEQEHPVEVMGLYLFYYRTAKWQKNGRAWCTVAYIMKGLKWGKDRVRKHRKTLLKLGLIKDIQSQKSTGGFSRACVEVIMFWNGAKDGLRPPDFTEGVNHGGKYILLNTDNKTTSGDLRNPPEKEDKNFAELNKQITPPLFEKFWNCYPKERRRNKGKTKTYWERLCRKPGKERPTWLQIKKALFEQKQTGQWQNPDYIPVSTTWLNQQRWLDDPATMVSYNSPVKKPPQTSPQQIVESYFPVKGGRREIMLALWKRVDNIGTGVEENKQSQTVQQMCELVKWYEKSRNKRVEEIYVVPTLLGLLEKYVAYLEEENWIDQPGPNLFSPTGKVFKTFFYKIQRDVGVDFLTGSSYR